MLRFSALPLLLTITLSTHAYPQPGGKPALGFNNWDIVGCNATMPNAAEIMRTADQFVKRGLKAAGYSYINMVRKALFFGHRFQR